MRKVLCVIASSLVLLLTASSLMGQVATGTYQYGTFDTPGIDTINVGNLNVHLSIPVFNKTGRGLPLSANLNYDSSIYYPATVSSSWAVWDPAPQFGWASDTAMIFGKVSYSSFTQSFTTPVSYTTNNPNGPPQSITIDVTCYYTAYANWVYTDPSGVSHAFSGSTLVYDGMSPDQSDLPFSFTCNQESDTPSSSGIATDGSGYQISISNYTDASVSQTTGTTTVGTNGTTSTETDSNGNQISTDGQGNYTDTTGHVVLRVTGNTTSSQIYTYYDTHGNPQQVSVNYSPYTVQTNFGCSGVGEYGPATQYLVSSITYPDGSAYHFTYESTPGYPSNVTGRIASIELPQGGTINYAYTGGNNGIECADGSTAGLTRTTSSTDGSAASTWTYARTITGTDTSQTTVTDGLDNSKVYNFSEPANDQAGAAYYETSRAIYQGAATGTPVLAVNTCYNQSAPCPNETFSFPVNSTDTDQTLNGIETDGSTIDYLANGGGAYTEVQAYDFGTSGSRGSLLNTKLRSYTSSVPYEPIEDEVEASGGALIGETLYNYDQSTPVASSGVPQHVAVSGPRRNLTSITLFSGNGSTSYTTTMTYEDTGSLLTSTTQDPDCTSGPSCVTTMSYDPTFTYLTGAQLPTPQDGVNLLASASYDTANTGLPLTSTDANGQVTSISSYDSMLRPTEENFPDGGETTWSWSPTEAVQNTYHSSGEYGETVTQYDAYGRVSRTATADGANGAGPYYIQDTCYDANGNVAFVSYPYSASTTTGSKVCSGAGGDTSSYDVLGRLTKLTRGDGETHTYTYWGRATKSVDENGVTRISQVDGLGRTTIVCEISSNSTMPDSGSPTSCGTDIAGTGFVTTYAYSDTSVNGSYMPTTTVTQGAQTRAFETDWLGRPISTQEPESGATSYSYAYNSTGLVVTRFKPEANQSNPIAMTTTTTQYDILGRPISISHDDGSLPKNYVYDVNCNQGWGPSYPQNNLKGRLSAAYIYNPNAGEYTSVSIYGYDAMGRTVMLGECTPASCGTNGYPLDYTYDLAGNMLTSTDGAGVKSTYTYSPANEVLSVTSSQDGSLLGSATYGPFGPLNYNLGDGTGDSFGYDSLGRLNSGGSGGSRGPVYAFSATWQGNQVKTAWDTVLTGLGGQITYGYDEFGRLISQKSPSTNELPSLTWVYDRYGNRWQQNVTAGTGPQAQLSFNVSNNEITSAGYSYDAAGNLLTDGQHSYTYDADGNITAVDGGATATYTYDALNHRVETNVDGVRTEFVYNAAGQRVSEWNGNNRAENEGNYYWGSRPLAFYTTTPDNDGYTLFFEHQDWEGTERARTDASSYANSSPDATFYSLPYGDAQAQVEDQDGVGDLDANHYGMLDSDMESGTDHARFRQYSPAAGRWMRPDPYSGSYDMTNPQSMNRYVYAMNSPLSNIDPSGLQDGVCDEGGYCGVHFEGGITGYSVGGGGDNDGVGGGFSSYNLNYTVVTETTTTYRYFLTVDGVMYPDEYVPNAGFTMIPMEYSWTSYNSTPESVMLSFSSSYSWGSSGSSSGSGGGGSAPNNGPTWKQKNQDCLNKINSTPDGKFYNFFSPLSMIPGIGPEWKSSIAEDVGGGAAKFAAYKFFSTASQTMVRTPFGSMSGVVAGSIEGVAEGVLAPVAAAATVGQLTVHAGCAISAAF